MRIVTTYRPHPTSNVGSIVARGMDTQKTTRWDQSKSTDQNHGIAAANLILAKSAKMHPLTQQNGDHLGSAAVRSIDAGASTHTSSDDGQRHVFEV